MKGVRWLVQAACIVLLLALSAGLIPAGVQAQSAADEPTETPTEVVLPKVEALPGDYVEDEVVVKLSNPASHAQRRDLSPFGKVTENSNELADLGVVILKVAPGTVSQVIAALQEQDGVVYAEPNYFVYALDTIPNDPGWGQQYGPGAVRAPQGWDMATGSPAVTIAVLDSGVQAAHPDLSAKLVSGYDFVNGDSDPADDYGHGTRVAGIAAAITDNGQGVAGISWGARIMPVKVLNSYGSGTYANVAAGIRFAVDNGARVINLSLGGGSSSTTLLDAVNYAVGLGAVLVAAAGNSGGALYYPAAYPDVVAVGATDNLNVRAASSSHGPQLDLTAPGVGIYTTQLGGGYAYESGTSAAAPFVSGAAAILIGIPGNGFSSVVVEQMLESAKDLGDPGFDEEYGWGLLQLDRALRRAGLTPPALASPVPSRTHTPDPLTPTPQYGGWPPQYGGWVYVGPGVIRSLTPSPSASLTAATQSATPTPASPDGSVPSLTPSGTPTGSLTPAEVAALMATRNTFTPTPTPLAAAEQPSPVGGTPFGLPLPCLGAAFLIAGAALILFIWRMRRHQ